MSGTSMQGAGLEGSVAIRLAVADGRVRDAAVTVRRPAAARALAGRTAEEAVRLVPLLFSLCGTAQALAATAAVEAALGIDATAHHAARALLIDAESAGNHAWQVLMEWPKRLGEAPRPADLLPPRAAGAAIGRALYPTGDAMRSGGGALRPDRTALLDAVDALRTALNAAIFGGPGPTDLEELAGWAATGVTPAARLMRRALRPELAGFGVSAVMPLGSRPAAWFAERLAADPRFAAHPQQDGAPAHTGPLARHAGHPLVAGLLERHGAGVAAHLAARLADLTDLPRRMATLADAVEPAEAVSMDVSAGSGAGGAAVETARGRLAHWLRLEEGRVADYRIVAPTEWNFAPDGPLAQGLAGAVDDDGQGTLTERAELLVTALDPCVAFSIAIEREG